MALPARLAAHRRHWFGDARDDDRQLEVTWHPADRLVVLSLWQGGTCRATFRLPIEDAADVIGALSAALGEAVATGPGARPSPPSLLDRLLARLTAAGREGGLADVVRLRGRR